MTPFSGSTSLPASGLSPSTLLLLRALSFPLMGPVGKVLVDVLTAGHRTMMADEFLGQVLIGDGADLMLRLLIDNPEFIEAQADFWGPTLAYGRKREELRADLNYREIIGWFLISQIAIAERAEYFADDAAVRAHVKQFVVRAILA